MTKNFSAKSYKEQLKKTGSFHTNKELALYIKQVLQSIATSDINEVIPEQTNYHDSLLNMLKAVIKKYSTKNKDMFKRERSLFNIVF